MRIERRLAELGLDLPAPMESTGLVLPFPWVRVWGDRAYISGHGPLLPDGSLWPARGKVGTDLSEEDAYSAARATALVILASLKAALGDLDRPGFPLRPARAVSQVTASAGRGGAL